MLGSERGKLVTVQEVMTPVPATLGSARAGYQSSISNDCNGTPVGLAGVAQNATSKHTTVEQLPFNRNSVIKRTPPMTLSEKVENPFERRSVVMRSPQMSATEKPPYNGKDNGK